MDRIKQYEQFIIATLQAFIAARQYAVEGLKYQLAADAQQHHYYLTLFGWQNDERIYHLIAHLDIIDGKIWIQEDQTEIGIANLLLEKGIQEQEIVLAYFSAFHRQFTDFAVM